jgi:serine/threonine protein kinase
MAYLHSKRFVHFDLKCDNVLTAKTSRGGGGGGGAAVRCKVCDFGLSKRRGSRASFVSGINAHRGTLPWTAPELLCDPGRASEKVDVHSFAVLMWELWTGRYPFEGQREQTIMYAIMTGGRPELPPEEEEDATRVTGGGGFSVPRGARGGEGERRGGDGDPEKGGGLEKTGASEKDGRRAEDVDENARAAGGGVSESSDVHPGDGPSTNELGFIPEPCEGWRGLIEASWAEAPERRPSFDTLAEVLEKGVGRARERREARRIAAAAERKRLAAEKENDETSPSATS